MAEPVVRVFADTSSLIAAAAQRAVADRGLFSVVLADGGTPQALYERLALRLPPEVAIGTALITEVFARRQRGPDHLAVEARIAGLKLITPYYQHVDGTSFAAPLTASVVACMLEANPDLSPGVVRQLLMATAQPVPGAAHERQGAGALAALTGVRCCGDRASRETSIDHPRGVLPLQVTQKKERDTPG